MKAVFLGIENNVVCYRPQVKIYEHSIDKCMFYLEDILLTRSDLIPKPQECTLNEQGDSLTFQFHQTKDFYLAVVYSVDEITKNSIKHFKFHVKILLNGEFKMIDSSRCLFINNQAVPCEKLRVLIGEVLVCTKKNYCFRLASDQIDFFHDATQTIPILKAYGTIIGVNEYYLMAKADGCQDEALANVAVFYQINNLDPSYRINDLIGKRVKILKFNCYTIFKFAKDSPHFELTIIPTVDLIPNIFPEYIGNTGAIQNERLRIGNTVIATKSLKSISTKCLFLSIPCMNRDLGSVIGLAIIEHMFRYPNDRAFKALIPKIFAKNSRFLSNYSEIALGNITNFTEFNKLIVGQYAQCICGFGSEIEKSLKADILTISGWQELSTLLGVDLKIIDFTTDETFNLLPLSNLINPRPIFRLGRYYTNFFLYYSDEIMQYDGYTLLKSYKIAKVTNMVTPLPMQYPFYDFIPKNTSAPLTKIFESLIGKLKEIETTVLNKAQGKSVSSIEIRFDDVANSIKEYSESIEDKELSKIGQEFSFIDLTSSIYAITPPQRFYCHYCKRDFEQHLKVKYTCGCEMDKACNNLLVGGTCPCRRSSVQFAPA